MLDEMKEPLAEKNISLSYDDKALKSIAEESYGKPYGARDIRRVIRQEVEDKIAEIIIERASETKLIAISADDAGKIVVEGKKETEQNED
jgi:ATP-dependent Clp protease ATP-binding subunit ClpA